MSFPHLEDIFGVKKSKKKLESLIPFDGMVVDGPAMTALNLERVVLIIRSSIKIYQFLPDSYVTYNNTTLLLQCVQFIINQLK